MENIYKNKKLYNILIIVLFLAIIVINLSNNGIMSAFATRNTSIAKIVMDADTKRVLYEENAHSKMFMASTTKIITCLTIIENCNINDIVKVPDNFLGVEGSSIYLKAGEKLSVESLLYGLMLRSGNDCAEVLAKYCSGSIEKFADLMNKTVKSYGLTNTNFTNPHGLHNDNHYTTAYDLAYISAIAMNNEVFRKIVGTKSVRVCNQDNYVRLLINKNKMLNSLTGADGIKTGFTKNAGRCLVTSCVRDGHRLISVVLNCAPMWEESKTMLENAFSNYGFYKVLDNNKIIGKAKINNTDNYCLFELKKPIIVPLTDNEKESIKIEYDIPLSIEKYAKSEIIGKINVYALQKLIFSENVYIL